MKPEYDALIVTTAKDFFRLKSNYHRLIQLLPARKLIFVGSSEVGRLLLKENYGERVGFLEEDEVLSFDAVHTVMKKALGCTELERGVTGWYYQQFLKMQYAFLCEEEYYMVWDGDTIPCRRFSMFCEESGKPYLDLKHEHHEEYFKTMEKLIPGLRKSIEQSFISEHMLMKCEIMKQLIGEIQNNQALIGDAFYEKILFAIAPEVLGSNSFSEFETYGTYVSMRYVDTYRLRSWHSFRYGGEFFHPDLITEDDYEWLGKDFDAISFEKNHFVREDHKDIFTKKEYQQKLSARQILEIVQQEFQEGYLEVFDD